MNVKSLATIALLSAATLAWAQDPPPGNPPPQPGAGREGGGQGGPQGGRQMRPPMGMGFQYLYPPELVMRNADKIDLKDDQKEAIKNAMPQGGDDARAQQHTEAEKLEQLLKSNRVDEAAALAQADKLMQIENDFKHKQLEALIKLKNILTPDQQTKLDEMKKEMRGRMGGGDAEGRRGPGGEGRRGGQGGGTAPEGGDKPQRPPAEQ